MCTLLLLYCKAECLHLSHILIHSFKIHCGCYKKLWYCPNTCEPKYGSEWGRDWINGWESEWMNDELSNGGWRKWVNQVRVTKRIRKPADTEKEQNQIFFKKGLKYLLPFSIIQFFFNQHLVIIFLPVYLIVIMFHITIAELTKKRNYWHIGQCVFNLRTLSSQEYLTAHHHHLWAFNHRGCVCVFCLWVVCGDYSSNDNITYGGWIKLPCLRS